MGYTCGEQEEEVEEKVYKKKIHKNNNGCAAISDWKKIERISISSLKFEDLELILES